MNTLLSRAAPQLVWLRLFNFRCYPHYTLHGAAQGVTLIQGANGTGKTSLLEALSLLGSGRGLRGAMAADIATQQSPSQQNTTPQNPDKTWRVEALLLHNNAQTHIVTSWHGRGTRKVAINNESVSQQKLAQLWPVLWLCPEQDRLFAGGKEPRRTFFDRLLSGLQPQYARALTQYQKDLAERMQVLQSPAPDERWLTLLEQRAAHNAAIVLQHRESLCQHIRTVWPQLIATDAALLPFAALHIMPDGEAETLCKGATLEATAQVFMHEWQAARARDGAIKMTLWGIHRTGYTTNIGPTAAHMLSSGEQKLLTLLLFVAVCLAAPTPPVVLIDDLSAYLDAKRAAGALQVVQHFLPQAIVSSCL